MTKKYIKDLHRHPFVGAIPANESYACELLRSLGKDAGEENPLSSIKVSDWSTSDVDHVDQICQNQIF